MIPLGLALSLAAASWAAEPDPSQSPRIYGGEDAEGTHPATIAIEIGGELCTAALVTPTFAFTAGHCLVDIAAQDMVASRGDDIFEPAQTVGVADFGIHPQFCQQSICDEDIYDIGWIRLSEPLDVPVEQLYEILVTQEDLDAMSLPGANLDIIGYGRTETGLTGRKFSASTKVTGFSQLGTELNAGGGGTDSCNGDSGGPALFRRDDGSAVLAGVTSRGSSSCGQGGVYTMVFPALCWVRDDSGEDFVPEGCGDCACVDYDPNRFDESGCGCVAANRAAPLGERLGWQSYALAALVPFGWWRRRRRTRPPTC